MLLLCAILVHILSAASPKKVNLVDVVDGVNVVDVVDAVASTARGKNNVNALALWDAVAHDVGAPPKK